MQQSRTSLSNRVFDYIHQNNLVYNTCWEDPKSDKLLLDLNPNSKMVMITSAGCNALSYSLESPNEIHCIDVNPRQNALLELKKALIKNGNHEDLFSFFGKGALKDYLSYYNTTIRPHLGAFAQKFWDKNIHYFSPKLFRRSFYFHGTCGAVAYLMHSYIAKQRKLYHAVLDLLESDSKDEKAKIYKSLEPKIFNKLAQRLINTHLAMSMLGVPKSQQALFTGQYKDGATGFIKERLRHVFTKLDTVDNYFYRVYLTGSYTTTCAPEYLEPDNFSTLQTQVDNVHTHTTTISNFLKENPGQYTDFVLLDHQDWLAQNDRDALAEEWQLIIENSKPGTRILLRSASAEVDFLPSFVYDKVDFNQIDTTKAHHIDRVGTYASTLVGVVNN